MNIGRELWALRGHTFILPISVVWIKENIAEVRTGCGLALLKVQQAAAAKVLNQVGQQTANKWICQRTFLEAVAKPHVNDDPETVVRWQPDGEREVQFENMSEHYQFLAHAVRANRFQSVVHADLAWRALCNAALNALAVDNISVNMGFCTLKQFPYRMDWKQTTAARESAWTDVSLFERRQGKIQRCLEVDPANDWPEHVDKSESSEYAKGDGYFERIESEIRRRMAEIKSTFARWVGRVREEVSPIPVVLGPPDPASPPRKRTKPARSGNDAAWYWNPRRLVPFGFEIHVPIFGSHRSPLPDMPELRNFRLPDKKLREFRLELERQWGDETGGVSLPDGDQIGVA